MKFKGTYIFSALVVALVAYSYFFEYKKDIETTERKAKESTIISFTKDQISEIEIKKKNAQGVDEILLVKKEKQADGKESWQVKIPLVDLGDATMIDEWLDSVIAEKSLDELDGSSNEESKDNKSVSDKSQINWASYGLDKPKAFLTLKKGDGADKLVVTVSPRKNFEGNSFIRKNEDAKVLVAASGWLSHIEKSAFDFRDKHPFRDAAADIELMKITNSSAKDAKADTFSLQLIQDKWMSTLTGTEKWLMNQNKIRELVTDIADMKGLEYTTEVAPNTTQISQLGLKNPSLKIELQLKGGKSWSADFGQSSDKSWYVWSKNLNKVLKVDQAQVDKLLKAKLKDLRDNEFPFQFAKADVKKVIVTGAKTIELDKEGEKWKSASGETDATAIDGFVTALQQLKVVEFKDSIKEDIKKAEKSFENPKRKVQLIAADGKSIFEMALGDSFKKKIDGSEKNYQFAKTSKFTEIFSVEEAAITGMGWDKMIKPPEPKPENKPK